MPGHHIWGELTAPELAAIATIATIEAIGGALAQAGIRRLLIFNSHGGNKAVRDITALKLRAAQAMLVVKANYFRFAPPADALGTSLMLHLAPEQVRRTRILDAESLRARRADAVAALVLEGDATFAWMAQDLHASGVTGDARLAAAECGQRLCAHFSARLAELIGETVVFDLADLADLS